MHGRVGWGFVQTASVACRSIVATWYVAEQTRVTLPVSCALWQSLVMIAWSLLQA